MFLLGMFWNRKWMDFRCVRFEIGCISDDVRWRQWWNVVRTKIGLMISGAISLAVEEINNHGKLKEMGHFLEFKVAETYGEEVSSIRQTAALWTDKVYAYIGPQETCVHEGRMAAAFNLPMISYVSFITFHILIPAFFVRFILFAVSCCLQLWKQSPGILNFKLCLHSMPANEVLHSSVSRLNLSFVRISFGFVVGDTKLFFGIFFFETKSTFFLFVAHFHWYFHCNYLSTSLNAHSFCSVFLSCRLGFFSLALSISRAIWWCCG